MVTTAWAWAEPYDPFISPNNWPTGILDAAHEKRCSLKAFRRFTNDHPYTGILVVVGTHFTFLLIVVLGKSNH